MWRLLGIAVAVLLGAGCGRDRATAGSSDNPFAMVISSAHATPAAAKQLEAMLTARSGMTVRVTVTAEGADAVRAAGAQRADAGLLPVFEYLLARQEYDVAAGLQVVRAGSREYAGVLLVRDDSPLRSVSELQGRKVAFVEPTSTTGHLLARRALRAANVDVVGAFAGSHDAAVSALASGDVDAAATYAAPRAGTRVLAETGTVPNEPVFFSKGVPGAVRGRFERALVDLASTPDGAALLVTLAGITGFAPVGDDAYHPVHDLLRETATSVPDLVPGGRDLVEWNQAPGDVYAPI